MLAETKAAAVLKAKLEAEAFLLNNAYLLKQLEDLKEDIVAYDTSYADILAATYVEDAEAKTASD